MEIQKPQSNAYVLGVGMTKFIKPRQTRSYVEMGFEAGAKAMLDAQITYDDVQLGVGCFCYVCIGPVVDQLKPLSKC